ncbi:MAG: Hsp20/alpha crystallin family protein [Balneolaceae bacterium]
MTLTKYRHPDIDVLGRTFSDVMDEFFNNGVSSRRDAFVPGTDISETDKHYQIDVHLPGLKKEDIDVNVEDRRLTISGERKFNNETKDRTFHKVETGYGAFTRSFHLPENIDRESVNATYKDGILSVTVDKSEEKIRKQIAVK